MKDSIIEAFENVTDLVTHRVSEFTESIDEVAKIYFMIQPEREVEPDKVESIGLSAIEGTLTNADNTELSTEPKVKDSSNGDPFTQQQRLLEQARQLASNAYYDDSLEDAA